MRNPRSPRRVLTAVIAACLLLLGLPLTGASAAGGPNIAAGRPATASSAHVEYGAANLTDGDPASYWQSAGTAFPQWAQADLGAATRIDQVVLRLPAGWESRGQTLSVQGSTDGTAFATLKSSAAYTFAPGSGNAVTIAFPATEARYVRVHITANTGWQAAQLSELEAYAAGEGGENLARGSTLTASSHTQTYAAAHANDGSKASYWESENNALPQWIRADLGASVSIDRAVLRLPDGWGARTQTLKLQTSTNGTDYTDLTAATGYAFNAANSQSVTISFGAVTTRYLRVLFTANTEQPAGQLSELEIYGPAGGDTQAPTAPANLAFTEPATGQIRLTWTAASDNVGVTGYDIYADGELRTSVAGNVTAYTDTQPESATVSYYVRARDAAGNQSANSDTVTRTGSTGDTQAPTAPANLAFTEPAADQIRLTWTAASDNVGVTGYEVYANNVLRTTVGGTVTAYTDTQSASATVTYHVRAKDAAGNRSGNSNSVTRNGSPGSESNLAVGKPITASSVVHTFVAENANDNSLTTYWEGAGGSYPNTLTVKLGANADVSGVVLKLNPDSAWGARTQNIQVLGREQNASGFTSLVAARDYAFDPAGGNTVTVPLTARVADVQLRFTSNTGAPAGQLAEFQVLGSPAPNPDLEITEVTASPASPVESDSISLTATVRNSGSLASTATDVAFRLGGTKVATGSLGALAAGATATVSASIGTRDAGSYQIGATADEAGNVIEQNETDNSFTNPTALVVRPVDSSDLVASAVTWSPTAPAAGDTVAFSVALKNQGTVASAGGSHGITLSVVNAAGSTVRTLTGAHSGTLAPGASAPSVNLGTWPAADGTYTVRVVVADDANELPVKRANNTSTKPLFVGRGANMPYEMYEAEDGVAGGGAQVVGPNRTIGDLAGEASGRRAVTLNSTGNYVEFTTRAPTNTLVTRFSIPDAPGGGGIDSTLNIYVDGTFRKAIDLTSTYMWQYGAEASPGNSPGAGAPRHIYDEANVMLGETVPEGSRIRLQKDSANPHTYAIDFVNLEQATAAPNPDPAAYTVPAGTSHQDVQNALDRVRMDTTGTLVGVYLPPGTYQTANKFQVYGKPVKVLGAGPWFSRFATPAGQENTDAGFAVQATANGSSFSGFAFFGNYTARNDGPGKVFDWAKVSDMTIDNVWVEHMMCLYWGTDTDRITIKNSRIRDLYADGLNFTNGSSDNLVSNVEARTTGDDAFALFPAVDIVSANQTGNVYENITSLLTWRAAGIAIYGGSDNTVRNAYVADTLTYPGLTIATLKFGSIPALGFGTTPTVFENITLERSGGHFWGNQAFPALWMYSAEYEYRGIRINGLDITDPTYSGIMFQTKYNGSQSLNPVTDSILTDVSISGARKSGDAFDAKSGFGLWVNELPEPGQGPAVGEVTFNGLRFSNNAQDVRNTTSTFRINVNP